MILKYPLLTNILTGIVALVASFFIYWSLHDGQSLLLHLNWNIFESPILIPLYLIGVLLALGEKFVFKAIIRNKETGEERPNHDLVETMFASIIMPLLMYLVVYPIMVAVAIYYPIMLVVHLFGMIFSYLLIFAFVYTIVIVYNLFNWSLSFNSKPRILRLLLIFNGALWYFWLVFALMGSYQKTAFIILGASVIGSGLILFTEYQMNQNNETYLDLAAKKIPIPNFFLKAGFVCMLIVLVMAMISRF